MVGGGDAPSRVKRFQENYMPEDGYDSDQEEELSYTMFIDDLHLIRKKFIQYVHESMAGQIKVEKKFSNEREFFMNELQKAESNRLKLEHKISGLEKDLDNERNYNL